MKKIFLAVSLISFVQTFAQSFKDQGFWNDFHRENTGKIVFSSDKIVHNSPDPKLVKTEFNLFDQIKGRVYISKSLANLCEELDKSGKYSQDEFNYTKFNDRIRLKGVISVDGVVQSDYMIDNLIDYAKKTEWTTWWYSFVGFKDSPYFNQTETTPEYAFGKALKSISAGKHKIKISYYMLSLNPRYNSQIEIASGEFTLNVDAKKKEEWLSINSEENYGNVEESSSENSSNSSSNTSSSSQQKQENKYVEIKITNDLNGDFKFYYNGGQNYINSGGVRTFTCEKGQKFYFNMNGSQGKVFLEVTGDMNGKAFKTSEFK